MKKILLIVLLQPMGGCAIFKAAYRVDPVVVEERVCSDEVLDVVATPLRLALGTPALDPIALDEYRFPGDKRTKVDPCPVPSVPDRLQGGVMTTPTTSPAHSDPPSPVSAGERPSQEPAAGGPIAPAANSCESVRGCNAYQRARACHADRDRLVYRIVSRSNDMCVHHMSAYVSQQALNELILGSSALGLTAAGAVVTGGVTQVLSATATAVSGFRSLVNEAVYFEQLAPVLLARALAQRDAYLARIQAKLEIFSLKENTKPAPCDTGVVLVKVFENFVTEADKAVEERRKSLASAANALKALGASNETAAAKSEVEEATKNLEAAEKNAATQRRQLADAQNQRFVCRSWDEYGIDAAIADVQVFHDACSFYRALGFAEEDIRQKAQSIASALGKIYKQAKEEAQTSAKPISTEPGPTTSATDKSTSP